MRDIAAAYEQLSHVLLENGDNLQTIELAGTVISIGRALVAHPNTLPVSRHGCTWGR